MADTDESISLLLVCSSAISQAKYSAWLAAVSSLGLRTEVVIGWIMRSD
jgi:hypothetical protein